jgi:peptide deformylase
MRDIDRPSKILVKGITPDEKEVEFEADGLLARVLQHEIDHLNGTLFIDHLESFERNELRKNLKKIKKMNKAS